MIIIYFIVIFFHENIRDPKRISKNYKNLLTKEKM